MPKKKEKEAVCQKCGKPCRRCTRPSFIPENPNVTTDQVLLFAALNVSPGSSFTTAHVLANFAAQGLASREDASNRLRKLARAGMVEIVGRQRRELFYQVTDAGRRRARELKP